MLKFTYTKPYSGVVARRTPENYARNQKIIGLIWGWDEFMPPEVLDEEFALEDNRSRYYDFLEAGNMRFAGFLANAKALAVLQGFYLQEHRLEALTIYNDEWKKGPKSLPYHLVHFHSGAAPWVGQVNYSKLPPGADKIQRLTASYQEYLDNEVDIPFEDKIAYVGRKRVDEVKFYPEKFPNGFFDLFYCFHLFENDFLVSPRLREALEGLTGFALEDGPVVSPL
jgi:hypothetical protein